MGEQMRGYVGCPVPTDAGIAAGDRAAYSAAKLGSQMLLERILAYFEKHHPASPEVRHG